MKWHKYPELPKENCQCLVIRKGWNDVSMQYYSKYHNCWDTADADDYDFDAEEGEYWIDIRELGHPRKEQS